MPAALIDPARPRVIKRTIYIVVRPDGQEEVTQEDVDEHPEGGKPSIFSRLRKIIRKVIIGPDGKEQVTEEEAHFPELYVTQDDLKKRPDEWVRRVKLIRRVQLPDGSEQTTEEDAEEPEDAMPKGAKKKVTKLVYVIVLPDGKEQVVETDLDETKPGKFRVIRRVVRTITVKDGKRQVLDEKVEEPQQDEKPSALDKIIRALPSVFTFTIGPSPDMSGPSSSQGILSHPSDHKVGGEVAASLSSPSTKVIMRKVRVITKRIDNHGSVLESIEDREEPEVVTLDEFSDERLRQARKITVIIIHPDGSEDVSEEYVDEGDESLGDSDRKSSLNRLFQKTRKIFHKARSPDAALVEKEVPVDADQNKDDASTQVLVTNTVKSIRRIVKRVSIVDGKEVEIEEVLDEADTTDGHEGASTILDQTETMLSGQRPLVQPYGVDPPATDLEDGLVLSRLAKTIPLRKVSGDDGTNLNVFSYEGLLGATVIYVVVDEIVPSVDTGRIIKMRRVTKTVITPDGKESFEEHEDEPIDVTAEAKSLLWSRKTTRLTIAPDGTRHVTEEVERPSMPDKSDVENPKMLTTSRKTVQKVVAPDGQEHVYEKTFETPEIGTISATLVTPVSLGNIKDQASKALHQTSQDFVNAERLNHTESGSSPKTKSSDAPSTTLVTRLVKYVRKHIGLDGKESISEETREEDIEVPRGEKESKYRRTKIVTIIIDPSGKEHVTELYKDEPETPTPCSSPSQKTPVKTISVATSPLNPDPSVTKPSLKTVEVSLRLQENSGQKILAPQIKSSVTLEKSGANPTLELTKQWSTIDIPSTEVSEVIIPADESESLKDISISSSLVESTDILVPDDTISVDSPQPTEDILPKDPTTPLSDVDSKTKTLEHGYEPDDTTMDEFSLSDDVRHKGKKKTKKRQKLPVNWSDAETNVPKSSPATISVGGSIVSDEGAKAGVQTAAEVVVESPRSTANTLISSPDDLVRVVEENVVSRPASAEAGVLLAGQVAMSVPVLERVPTQEEGAQTTGTMRPETTTEDLSVQTVEEPTQEESVQTSPRHTEESPQKIAAELLEEGTQTTSPQLPELQSAHSQTVTQETKDDGIQTISPEPVQRPSTAELSMQTDTTKQSESGAQTSKPTSPLQEVQHVTTDHASVQTPVPTTDDQSVQTKSAEPVAETGVQAICATSETSQQTTTPDSSFKKTDLSNAGIQTSPVPMNSDDEHTSSASSDQPFEVSVKTSVTFAPGTDSFTVSDISLRKEDIDKMKRPKGKRGPDGKMMGHGKGSEGVVHTNVAVDPLGRVVTTVELSADPKTMTERFLEGERPQEQVKGLGSPVLPVSAINQLEGKLLRLKAGTQHPTRRPNVLYLAALQDSSSLDPDGEEKRVKQLEKELHSRGSNGEQIGQSGVAVIEAIASWLETIQYRIMVLQETHSKEGPSAERIQELGKLRSMTKRAQNTVQNTAKQLGTHREQFDPSLASLTEQGSVVESLAKSVMKQQQRDLARWEEFLNAVNVASVIAQESRGQVDGILSSDTPTRELIDILDQVEATNRSNMAKITTLLNDAHGLLRDFPGHALPPEIYSLQDSVRLLGRDITENREHLEQRISLAAEYEATLGELEQITDVAEALVTSPIVVSDLHQLQEEMQKHRKFFVNLSHCRSLLESLEGSLDPETRTSHAALHGRLHARATSILDAAASRSQQMALAASRWTLLDAGVREEKKWLQVARQRLPDLNSVTCNDYDQYISLHQSLQSDVALHHARILHLTNTAHTLQTMVSCPALENNYDEQLETVLALRDEVGDNLQRLQAFREAWKAYEALTDRLGFWLAEVEMDLTDMEAKAPTENMRRYWELKAQQEVHGQVRTEANAQLETALRVIPVSDEMSRRGEHSTLDERWRRVVARVDAIQAVLTSNLQANDVPVANKLHLLEKELQQLGAAFKDMNGVLKTQEELSLYVERLQVMRHRTIHIQEDLSRLGLLPTAESDRVGALLSSAKVLENVLSEELENAAALRDTLQSLDSGLTAVSREHQRDEDTLRCCAASEGEDSEVVQKAILECEGVGRDLEDQWQDLMALRQVLHTLPAGLRVSVSPGHLERRISASQDAHAGLEARCQALRGLLATRLKLWQTFEERLEAVRSSVQEADYMVELLSVGTALDLDRLVTATERLEAVRASLSERGDLVGSLALAAEPLRAVCCPEVAARVDAAVREAGDAYDGAQEQVALLTERYERVVTLWKRYRDAADQLRDFTDHLQLPPANLPPEELARAVQVTEEAVAAKQQRLEELRALAAEISESLGVPNLAQSANGGNGGLPLDAELAALDRRLAAVRDSIQSLDKVADSKQRADKQLSDTRAFLGTVHKDVSATPRTSESDAEAGERLVALREHLLQLGATEGHLQALRDDAVELTPHTPPATPDPTRETSVVEILELWQQVFRDTFLQYRSLSARLVRSEDGVAALRLWQEYLLNLQAFLSAGLPGDYDALTQHQHQCEVHENLLTSQASVLLAGPTLDRSDPAVQRQLEPLNALHNETLQRIGERNAAVRRRLDLWASYRAAQSALLHWLQAMERERGRLQLRYISLRRLPQLAQRIGELLDKLPTGEKQAGDLAALQGRLLAGCDEALATSVRMEYAAAQQRIGNLRAGLETWRDFLLKLQALANDFDVRAAAADKELADVGRALDALDAPNAPRRDAVASLAVVRGLQQRLDDAVADLERLGVSEEKLKEAVSPTDLKAAAQRVRLLWQRHADLEHRLRSRAHALQEADSERLRYVARADRFLRWAAEQTARLERLDKPGGHLEADLDLTGAEALRRLEAGVSGDVELKRREADWLMAATPGLAPGAAPAPATDPHQKQVEEARKRVRTAWTRVTTLLRARTDKLHSVIDTAAQLQKRLDELRARLFALEKQLKTPLELDAPTQKAVNKRLKEHEELQRRIEHEAKEFGEVNQLCDVVRGDCDASTAASVAKSMESVEARWKSVCALSTDRKRTIQDLWKLLQELMELCANQRKWLAGAEKTVREVRDAAAGPVSRRDLPKLVQRLDGVLREVEGRRNSLNVVETTYSRLSRELANCPSLLGESRGLAERWGAVGPAAQDLRHSLLTLAESHDKFEAAHKEAVLVLTQIDARLSQLQLQEPARRDPRQLQALTRDLESRSALLTTADQLGLELMRAAPPAEVERLQALVDEYQGLWKDVAQRLEQLSRQVDQGVQVTTLRFETEAAVQVDTLPKRLTARDGYLHELQGALRELRGSTDRLEDLLVDQHGQAQAGDTSLASSRALGKATAACEASHELVRHLHSLLVQQCGMTPDQALAEEVRVLEERFHALRDRARLREREIRDLRSSYIRDYALNCSHGKLTCPLCSRRNWQQLDNDLWRLEKWLEHAEGEQSLQVTPPTSIEQLEDIIQEQREFLLNLDSHRSIVKSLNIVGVHLADHTDDEDRARELRARLASANTRWEAVCRAAAVWQTRLQSALMENDEFHAILEEQTRWLITTEENIQSTEPVDVTEDLSVIETKYLKFRDLHAELERYEPRVMSLQEAADSLLRHTDAPAGSGSTLQRLTDLRLRLQSLRRLTALYCVKLGAVLGRSPDELVGSARVASLASLSSELLDQASGGQLHASSHSIQANADSGSGGDAVDTRVLTRGYRFLGRVLRASLPIQALMLLLLGVATLMPADQDYSCVLTNNFARSFEPMLRYPNGPPPI
ncbi:nesprin-1-like [Thrips palmi]|uniref:Nesprin-1-like n=1 Tax=Thrips palmi TaxID=161013 RepID=A0A6P8ZNV3_THRPL|nr:nesprin-1-like [Thrips palmi]